LISATSPDPDRIFLLYIGDKPDLTTTQEPSLATPAAPVYRVEDIIELHTGIILDYNGNPVPDGTPVTFVISSQGESTSLPQVITTDGSTSTSYLVQNGNNIIVHAESSLAKSQSIEINILGDATDNTTDGATDGSTDDEFQDSTQTPVVVIPGTNEPSQPLPSEENSSSWRLWLISLIIIVTLSLIAYQAGAMYGIVRWGIKWSFSSFISGLFVYNYLMLDLPGVSWLISNTNPTLSMGLAVLVGSLTGWLLAFLYQRLHSS
jgi:hypothetical protein